MWKKLIKVIKRYHILETEEKAKEQVGDELALEFEISIC